MPELHLVADKIHAHSHRKDHRKLKEIKMGKVPVGVGEVTMLTYFKVKIGVLYHR